MGAGMGTISWKTKVGCLKLLGTLAHTAPTQIGQLLPEVVPKVTENMWDTKPEVKQAAKACGPFVDKLLPELKKVEEDVPIPEIRAYGAKAKATLVKAIKDGGGKVPPEYE